MLWLEHNKFAQNTQHCLYNFCFKKDGDCDLHLKAHTTIITSTLDKKSPVKKIDLI